MLPRAGRAAYMPAKTPRKAVHLQFVGALDLEALAAALAACVPDALQTATDLAGFPAPAQLVQREDGAYELSPSSTDAGGINLREWLKAPPDAPAALLAAEAFNQAMSALPEASGKVSRVDFWLSFVIAAALSSLQATCSPVPWPHEAKPAEGPALAAAAALVKGRSLAPGVRAPSPWAAALLNAAGVEEAFPARLKLESVVQGVAPGAAGMGQAATLALLGTSAGEAPQPLVVAEIEANIDDMPPELLEAAMDAAFKAGALDVWFTPIHMKRNRPAIKISALAPPDRAWAVAEALFRNTTTLGVRFSIKNRWCLERRIQQVQTPYGAVQVKLGILDGAVITAQPEYRSCAEAAEQSGAPIRAVYQAAAAEAAKLLGQQAEGE